MGDGFDDFVVLRDLGIVFFIFGVCVCVIYSVGDFSCEGLVNPVLDAVQT